jgi:hypothetical protein
MVLNAADTGSTDHHAFVALEWIPWLASALRMYARTQSAVAVAAKETGSSHSSNVTSVTANGKNGRQDTTE